MNDTWTESISQILGWGYFVLWSLSFYPQVLQNHRRRSTDGFSIDFALLNVLGLSAYTVSNACLLFSPVVRDSMPSDIRRALNQPSNGTISSTPFTGH